MTNAHLDEFQTPAEQLRRRALHLTAQFIALRDKSETELRNLHARRKTSMGEAELTARQHIDASVERDAPALKASTSLGSSHRQTLAEAGYPTAGQRIDPGTPPETVAAAIAEWAQLARLTGAHVQQLKSAMAEWEQKPGWRRKARPGIDSEDQLWYQLDRLDLLHRSFTQIRQNHVASNIRSVVEPIDLALADLLARTQAEQEHLAEQITETVDLMTSRATLPTLAWADARWREPTVAPAVEHLIRVGELRTDERLPAIPALLKFPLESGLAVGFSASRREAATGFVRSVILRLLSAVPPGALHLKVVDPVAIGQSVAEFRHLAEHDPALVDDKTWTGDREIERLLEDLTSHLEVVISTYLRGQFESIDEYNEHAGEVAEPYRALVVFDYPNGFSDRACEMLRSLIENGPRCGVFTVLHYGSEADPDRRAAVQTAQLVQHMHRVELSNSGALLTLPEPLGNIAHTFLPDSAPPIVFDRDGRPSGGFAQLLTAVGSVAHDRRLKPANVTLDSLLPILARSRSGVMPEYLRGGQPIGTDPTSWWSATTSERAVGILGRTGAQTVTAAWFSSTEVAGGAIMVGLPRSGKTTALHSMILSMAMLYSPDEIELYLIDAKHGVEFKVYETLPHVRMVSVHSEREFSLAVLRSLVAEIERRADLFKAAGQVNLPGYRRATGEVLSRVVVVMDEFHELFKEADSVGQDAYAAFSVIVKQGSSFGVHLVVASQTLSNMPAMDRQTLTLLPQRIAFQCNDYDAEIVMGDTNKGTRGLASAGAGLFNPTRGDEARNQLFQGLFISEDDRPTLVAQLAARAALEGWDRAPRVFDGHSTVDRPPANEFAATDGRHIWIPLGEPFSLARRELLALRRARSSNVLLLHGGDAPETRYDPLDDPATTRRPEPDQAMRGALHSIIEAACRQGGAVTLIDFDPDEHSGTALPVLEVARLYGAEYVRSGSLNDTISRLTNLLEARTGSGNYGDTQNLLILCGVERAAPLSPPDPYADDDNSSDSSRLVNLIQRGPDVGLHTVLWVDRLASFSERLGGDLLRDFAFRLAGSGTDHDDVGAVLPTYGAPPELPRGQLLFADHFSRRANRVRGYAPITNPSNF